MDQNETEGKVRKWSSADDARGLHEYLKEAHDIEQDPHLEAVLGGEMHDTALQQGTGRYPVQGRPSKRFRPSRRVLVVAVLATLVLAGAAAAFFGAASGDAAERSFTIEEGTRLTDIVRALETEGFIENYWSVALLLRAQGLEGQVKAGTFLLSPSMTPSQIVRVLTDTAPPADDIVVTIPEGFTAVEIALRLEENGIIEDGAALLNAPVSLADYPYVEPVSCSSGDAAPCTTTFVHLEGYLFPDTYRFPQGATPQDVADRFLKNFGAQVDLVLRAEAGAQGRSLRDIVIIASLVEEEARHDLDRPLIAGIILHRLELGMLLQIDATVLYAQEQVLRASPGNSPQVVDRELTFEDLAIDSPYNTYRYTALPPGPISNPGAKSLLAALRPEATEYLYYLHDADGNTHFGKTLEEHISNRNRYLR